MSPAQTMTGIRIFTVALTAVMLASIVIAMSTGDFGSEGSWLLDHPWGRMTLVDLYVGIAIFVAWVWIREPRRWTIVVWIPVFVVLGNAGTALYASIAAFTCDSPRAFLLGRRA
jgi:hypothetical protein